MKYLLVLIVAVILISLYGFNIPKSTENAGMNKYQRINKIEQDLISQAYEIKSLKKEITSLKFSIRKLQSR